MIKRGNIVLQTLSVTAAEQVFTLFSHPKIIKSYDTPPIEAGETAMVFTYRIIKGSNTIWQVSFTNKPNKLIGVCALHNYNANAKTIEIGASLLPKYWNKDIMCVALQYINNYAANNFAVKKIIAKTSPTNIKAIRLVSKLGFVKSNVTVNQTTLRLNIDKKTITKQAIKHLNNGEVILSPTDTIWGLSCNALLPNSVKKIDRIKNRPALKSYVVLLNSFEKLCKYVAVNQQQVEDLLAGSDKPITIIYTLKNNLLQHLAHHDNTLAIRIPKKGFMLDLLQQIEFPLVSTSANLSGDTAPTNFSAINSAVRNAVDFVVPAIMDREAGTKASTIIKILSDGSHQIIRA